MCNGCLTGNGRLVPEIPKSGFGGGKNKCVVGNDFDRDGNPVVCR